MSTLSDQLAVEHISPGCYRSVLPPIRMGDWASFAFGGNTLSVAVNSAYQTVEPSHHLYSICGHFVHAADTDRRLICEVESLKNTRSFQTRHIRVFQEINNGVRQLCLIASADFHILEPRSMVVYSTSPWTPNVQPTEHGLYSHIERLVEIKPIAIAANAGMEFGNQDSTSDPSSPSLKISAENFKIRGTLNTEAERITALAFYMDKGLAYIPASHSGYSLINASACTTLDFSLRLFTHEVDLRDWHLLESRTAVAGNARAFSEGRVWNGKGRLLASMTQQTLLRPRKGFSPRI
ncbi:conserved hypothetical protein [Talaromyces stipitatus ATCC 10500]|uniref:Acyl-CoA thioesterase II n=1 Tax=Talaromyces stipitatus (strain ATCC 10500 / CBS 375.48 / QM 6759 / NRRL 1006) TaxID=441959 RepID=B8MLL9_TALSN|nr:uncharacterized protein TSTA_049900 [Talaromyces stipitatus ATCC 10500]EED15552.1 conserved hypothetical protein [Talaromyces stipitatus ATCC 10500]